jgi:hypothetical protein
MKKWVLWAIAIALLSGSNLATVGSNGLTAAVASGFALATQPTDAVDRVWELIESARQQFAANQKEEAVKRLHEAFEAARAGCSADRCAIADPQVRNPLLVKIIAEYGAMGAYEEAIARLSSLSYDEPLPNTESSLRMEGEMLLTRAFVRAQQYDRALQFARGIAFEPSRNRALREVVSGYAREGQWDKAAAIAPALENDSYQHYLAVSAIVEAYSQQRKYQEGLAFLDTLAGEIKDGAARSLAVAAWQSGRYDIAEQSAQKIGNLPQKIQALRDLSAALLGVGQTAKAAPLVVQAFKLSQQTDEFLSFSWVEDFLATGQEERAKEIIATLKGDENETAYNRFSIASAYLKVGRIREAFEFAKKISDRVLLPLEEYPDPKVELFESIIAQALQAKQFDFALQVALTLNDKEDRVQSLQKIARDYASENNPKKAAETLNQALGIAKTIESISVVPERSLFWSEPNARLLLSLAEDYRKLGDRQKAVAILALATQSIQNFEPQYAFDFLVWNRSGALRQVAEMYLELEEKDKAVEVLAIAEREAQNLPGNRYIIDELLASANFYLKIGKADRAIAAIEMAQQRLQSLEPSSSKILSLIYAANLLEKSDRAEDAVKVLEQVLPAIETLEQKQDKISLWMSAIAAYHRLGQNSIYEELIAKTVREIQTLEPSYEKNRVLDELARTSVEPDSDKLVLEVLQQVSDRVDKARMSFAIASKYAQLDNASLATQYATQALAMVKTISNDQQRNELLAEAARNIAIIPLEDPDPLLQKPWRYRLAGDIAGAIANPELQAGIWLELAFYSIQIGDTEAAQQMLTQTFAAAKGIENQQSWRSQRLEMFENARQLGEYDFALQLAKGFEGADYQIVAMRRVAQWYAIAGNLEQARAILARATQIANHLQDVQYKQQALADIAQQQQNW